MNSHSCVSSMRGTNMLQPYIQPSHGRMNSNACASLPGSAYCAYTTLHGPRPRRGKLDKWYGGAGSKPGGIHGPAACRVCRLKGVRIYELAPPHLTSQSLGLPNDSRVCGSRTFDGPSGSRNPATSLASRRHDVHRDQAPRRPSGVWSRPHATRCMGRQRGGATARMRITVKDGRRATLASR